MGETFIHLKTAFFVPPTAIICTALVNETKVQIVNFFLSVFNQTYC